VQVVGKFVKLSTTSPKNETVLEFLNNLWGLGNEKGIVNMGCRTGPPGHIGWPNWFLGPIPGLHKRLKIRARGLQAGGINSLESILGPLKSLKIRAQKSKSVTPFLDEVSKDDRFTRQGRGPQSVGVGDWPFSHSLPHWLAPQLKNSQ
jgi:hypothetical protein